MYREKYWEKISEKVLDYLYLLELNPIDIYLVGSTIRGKSKNVAIKKDIDSVILIKDKLSLNFLRNIRLQIHKYLFKIDNTDLYHFKLFNEEELELLGKYDGFRLFEFQFSNTSICSTMNILNPSPLLNCRNFCNSVFIQTVYEFLKDNTSVSLDNIISIKAKVRIERNKEILKIAGKRSDISNNTINLCRHDKLFAFFMAFRSKSILMNPKFIFWFMDKYFKRFRHEYINKYYVYMNKIEQRLRDEWNVKEDKKL